MKLRNLRQFWYSPQQSGDGTDAELKLLANSLEPFGDWDATAFAELLKTMTPFASALVDLRAKVRMPDDGALTAVHERIAKSVADLGPTAGLTVTAKPDKKWIEKQRNAERSEALVRRLREFASQIVSPESYAAAELQPEFEAFVALSAADWKLLEGAIQQSFPGKGRGKIEAALAQISGHASPKPVKGKAAKAKPAAPTAEELAPHVQRLKDRMSRSNDRENFPRREVDEQIAELANFDANTLRVILQDASFEVGKKDSKPKMLEKLREFLDASHRAFERIQA